MSKSKIQEIVEKQIIAKLEEGVCPWVKGWADGGMPRNITTDREYNGINRLFTMMQGFGSPYWMSYKQAKELGGNVIKGEKGVKIVYARTFEKEDKDTGEKKTFPVFRYSVIFNLEQCEEVKIPKKIQIKIDYGKENKEKQTEINYSILTDFIEREKTLSFKKGKPSYAPKKDVIRMPDMESFFSSEEYVGTLAHECIHSTGHWMRLDRGFDKQGAYDMERDSYAKEELVAEIGSAFVCAMLGVEKVLDNQVAYIASWKKKIKETAGIVVSSASLAQRAVDYIIGETDVIS